MRLARSFHCRLSFWHHFFVAEGTCWWEGSFVVNFDYD